MENYRWWHMSNAEIVVWLSVLVGCALTTVMIAAGAWGMLAALPLGLAVKTLVRMVETLPGSRAEQPATAEATTDAPPPS